MTHGLPKLMGYTEMLQRFGDPIGLGVEISLILAIFAELVCSFLVAIGLFTRLAAIPPMITMFVAFLIVHAADPFGRKELAFLYLGMFLVVFLLGPGRFSLSRFLRVKNPLLQ